MRSMSPAFRKVRVVVLIVVFSFTVVPIAAAAPRDGDLPRFERISRAITKLLKKFGVAGNSDAVIIPRP
jgi:hypothetical protein